MKQLTLALLLLTFAVGCKKEPYEKKIRKVEISFSEKIKYKAYMTAWTLNCSSDTRTLYMKSGETLIFDVTVCNTPNVSVKVMCAGKNLYEKYTGTHNVNITIP